MYVWSEVRNDLCQTSLASTSWKPPSSWGTGRRIEVELVRYLLGLERFVPWKHWTNKVCTQPRLIDRGSKSIISCCKALSIVQLVTDKTGTIYLATIFGCDVLLWQDLLFTNRILFNMSRGLATVAEELLAWASLSGAELLTSPWVAVFAESCQSGGGLLNGHNYNK